MTLRHVKSALNGAPVPNWVKLGAFWVALGWIAANQWGSVKSTQTTLEASLGAKIDSLRTDATTRATISAGKIELINDRLDNLDQRFSAIETRIDYRFQQTKNALGDVQDKIDDVKPPRPHR